MKSYPQPPSLQFSLILSSAFYLGSNHSAAPILAVLREENSSLFLIVIIKKKQPYSPHKPPWLPWQTSVHVETDYSRDANKIGEQGVFSN